MKRPVSRRGFLYASSTVLASCALSSRLCGAPAAGDGWKGWPIGIQSYSLRNFNVHDAIRHIQGMGVRYVEFAGKHLELTATQQQIEEVKQLLQAAGIQVNAHGVYRFTKDHDANRKVFEFA
ncbi:MAG: hypothetical protein AB7F89_09420 [Pirellulaceae bacterium]